MNRTAKRIILISVSLILLICLCFSIDYIRVVRGLEMPLFCVRFEKDCIDTVGTNKNDDYMTCIGLGYKIDMRGNFRPDDDWEDEDFPGIKEDRFYLLGKEIFHGVVE
ncbi:MAG: hypothetical protein IKI69_07985 [Oscillospiraceae bacterium]|nr:hypothetical protein [Oscillospiraceae bacterium]